MKKAAAKRKRIFLLVAVCLLSTLLLVPTAEASRNLPKPLTPQLTPPATPAQILQDSDAKPEPRYRIFGDLSLPERPLGLVEAQKTASGVFTLGIQSNVWQTGGLEQNRSGPSFQVMVDELGRPTSPYRKQFDANTWLELTCKYFSVEKVDLSSRRRNPEIIRIRDLVALVGVERYGVRVKDLAASLGKSEDGVSLWARRGARRREEDPDFSVDSETLNKALQEER